MLTPEEIRQRLRNESVKEVATQTGLHYNTVRKVRDGRSIRPAWHVVSSLSAYLESRHDVV